MECSIACASAERSSTHRCPSQWKIRRQRERKTRRPRQRKIRRPRQRKIRRLRQRKTRGPPQQKSFAHLGAMAWDARYTNEVNLFFLFTRDDTGVHIRGC